MSDHLFYKLRSGKPVKFLNFLQKFIGLAIPDAYYRSRRKSMLEAARKRPDYEYLKQRVDYYMRITSPWTISMEDKLTRDRSWIHYTGALGDYRRKMFHTAYYFDQHDVTRWFPPRLRWNFCPGDVYFTPKEPTIVKSRLLSEDNTNSVVLKLDKLRHFMYVYDTKPFREKKDCAIFRGKGFDKHGIRIFDDGCGTKNDPTARYCRHCDHVLRDPNAALNERAYTDNEWADVMDFKVQLTKDGEGILYRYWINRCDGKEGWANEVFYPYGGATHMKNMFKAKAIFPHLDDKSMAGKILKCQNAKQFMMYAGLIKAPKRITHRINDKGRDIIHRKEFKGEQSEAA